MINTVTIRGLEIGAGAPKIIVPIVGKTQTDILEQARKLTEVSLHVVEWRVDHYVDVFDTQAVLDTLHQLRAILGQTAILFTFRTKKEGGEREIDMDAYTALNSAVAQSGDADLIDVEIFSGDQVVAENIRAIHACGVRVVGSNHDFHGTPRQADLVYRLRKMQDMGADIPKIAVMPQTREDVLTLLSATNEMYTHYADRPIITMSMAGSGAISRLCGEVFGSAMTFGSVGQGSAPGQIPVERLSAALDIIHDAL